MTVTKNERGWAGHFICSYNCNFRRNTLLSYKDIKVVISTVGMMRSRDKEEIETIGWRRYYETMAFYAKYEDPYWEADVSRGINFESNWALNEKERESDKKADEMHETVVMELTEKLKKGLLKDDNTETRI